MDNTSGPFKAISPLRCLLLFVATVAFSLIIYAISRAVFLGGPSKEFYGAIQSIVLIAVSVQVLRLSGIDLGRVITDYRTHAFGSLKKATGWLLALLGVGFGLVSLVLLADKALSWAGVLPSDGFENLLMPGENGLKSYLSEYVFQSKSRLVLFWATTAALAPIGEELFFRRLFYVGLREKYGFAKSALISSALFGILHGAGWFPVFSKSLVISYFYEKERNLLAVIFLHSLLNILGAITILLCLG